MVSGSDASKELQRICSANIDRGNGHTVYTLFLNEQGGVETACVVAKLKDDLFMITAGSGERGKVKQWLRNSIENPVCAPF